jgi:hypothetical protein
MSQRIRYVKEVDGSLRSGQYITSSSGNEYLCFISKDGMNGEIKHVSSANAIKTVRGTSAHKTKIAIKAALESLGCIFDKEVRTNKGARYGEN